MGAISDDLIFPLICITFTHFQTATVLFHAEFSQTGQLVAICLLLAVQIALGYLSGFFLHHSSSAGSTVETTAKICLFSELFPCSPFPWGHPVCGSCTFIFFLTFMSQLSITSRKTYPNRKFLSLPAPRHDTL